MTTDISIRQNEESQLKYMRAARQLYSDGKRILAFQIFLTVGLPGAGVAAGYFFPDPTVKAAVALGALAITIIDVSVIDRSIKRVVAMGAAVRERFDCIVLDMPWDTFAAGDGVASEVVHDAAMRFSSANNDDKLRNWYPTIVDDIPIHTARLVCQRANIWYDSTLRRNYGRAISFFASSIMAVLVITFLFGGMTLVEFVVGGLAPASPMLIWSVRESFRQHDTVAGQNRVRKLAESLWERVKRGECDEAECAALSRQFQTAVFARRVSAPLVFDWVYRLQRSRLENQMNAGAQHMVRELGNASGANLDR